ncbi:restriction endonuclease subunit S [Mycobacteroides abscessus]|uniref:Restriction endonuclease subunit S n=2 Tax=Mycobacteriaceae TaxID=1762 RepID=A0AA94RG85_9MYCO|nr:restriction endonuclease subunit S [Mycobacteroides abscessus]TLH74426.1 restriction endonuclease subunit S [Mycolicibacterium phocaicum]
MLRPGDLFVSLKGATKDGDMIGSVARVPDSVAIGRLTQDTVKLIFRDVDKSFERYLYWLLRTPDYRIYCAARASGSAVAALSRADFLAYPVPQLTKSRSAIVGLLEVIEDKIESNRRLATSASSLVDSMAARLTIDTETKPYSLSELVDFNRVTLRPGTPSSTIHYVDIASVTPGEITEVSGTTWAQAPSRARRGVADGDVIYSTVRPGRRSFAQILDPDPRTVVSTGFAVMTPSDRFGSSLLTTIAGSPDFASYLESVAHGSAYPAVSIAAMGNYLVNVPIDETLVAEFESETMPLRRKVHQARRESSQLVCLRDALLPELLAGRIRVPAAAQAIA